MPGTLVGAPVIEQQVAPVTAVSGNVDDGELIVLPSEAVIELAGRRIAIRHILYEDGKMTKEGWTFLEREYPDVCLFGHTHQPKAECFGKTLFFNPGSAGPKRFVLPRGMGLLTIAPGKVIPKLIRLNKRASTSEVGNLQERSKPKGVVR
jgi:uncharacterized protein